MSHLSPVAENPATPFLAELKKLKLGRHKGRSKPHKLFLLLAVADLFDRGHITDNRIYFNDELKASFSQVFEQYKKKDDWNQIAQPFWHLRTASFWNHKVREGRESIYKSLTTSGGGEMRVQNNIEYAYLSDDAFLAFSEPKSRAEIVDAIYLTVIQL